MSNLPGQTAKFFEIHSIKNGSRRYILPLVASYQGGEGSGQSENDGASISEASNPKYKRSSSKAT